MLGCLFVVVVVVVAVVVLGLFFFWGGGGVRGGGRGLVGDLDKRNQQPFLMLQLRKYPPDEPI